jgi:hypothetical protein
MKKTLLVIAVLTLVMVGQIAQATYLDSSWYANISNLWSGLGSAPPHSSVHLKVAVVGDAELPGLSFTVKQSGDAPVNETAYWGSTSVDPSYTLGPISFDYQTYWTQPNLQLQLWTTYIMPWQPPDSLVWSSSETGLQSGHVSINANPNGYFLRLVVVPEPSSVIVLSLLGSTGMLSFVRSRRGNRGQ